MAATRDNGLVDDMLMNGEFGDDDFIAHLHAVRLANNVFTVR